MLRYTLKRILTGILALFVLACVTFLLVRLMPGSPFQTGSVSEQVVEAVEREYGLDRPLGEQFLTYMGNLLRGDLGISYEDPGVKVTEIIGRTWGITASLGVPALIVAILAGTAFGIARAVSKNRCVREVISAVGMILAGIPGFAAAILLLLVFSVQLKWFPASGLLSPAHYVLPVISLAIYPAAVIMRLTGNALETEMEKDYVLFDRAKGLGRKQIIFTHALKNAWRPVLNYIGPASAYLLTGEHLYDPGHREGVCKFDHKQGLHADHGADHIYGSSGHRSEPDHGSAGSMAGSGGETVLSGGGRIR